MASSTLATLLSMRIILHLIHSLPVDIFTLHKDIFVEMVH